MANRIAPVDVTGGVEVTSENVRPFILKAAGDTHINAHGNAEPKYSDHCDIKVRSEADKASNPSPVSRTILESVKDEIEKLEHLAFEIENSMSQGQ